MNLPRAIVRLLGAAEIRWKGIHSLRGLLAAVASLAGILLARGLVTPEAHESLSEAAGKDDAEAEGEAVDSDLREEDQVNVEQEAAAAFDDITRNNRDDLLVRQIKNAWPNRFREARTVPAVEYLQANRLRTLVMKAMQETMSDIDVYVSPSWEGRNSLLTNLTGHPAVVVPNGLRKEKTPSSITFIGRLYGEDKVLAVAKAYQDATSFHMKHPVL